MKVNSNGNLEMKKQPDHLFRKELTYAGSNNIPMLRRFANAGIAAIVLFYIVVFIQFGTIWFFQLEGMKELVFLFVFLLVTLWTHEKVAAYFSRNREKFERGRITALLEALTVIIISIVYSGLFTFLPQYLFIETVEFTSRGIRLSLVIYAILSLFIYYFVEREKGRHQLQKEISEAEQLRSENYKAQLETIKSQIDPHFLFNSLNVLSSLVHRNPDKAVEFLGQLSRVYRIILDSGRKALIPLEAEMDLVKAYAYLMSTRFGSSLNFDIDLSWGTNENSIPPASIQMLVENAIKHNAFTKEEPLKLKIFILENYLVVENNVIPKIEVEESTKVGLENILSRYKLITEREVRIESTEIRFIVKLPLISEDKS